MGAVHRDATGEAEQIRSAILGDYRARTSRSAFCYQRASRVLAGGTTGNLRHFHPYPLYFTAGQGSVVEDVDGNHYLDCFLGNGPLLLGHRHPAIVESTHRYDATGSLVVNPPLAIELAEALQQLVPCAERVRFLNSGTEAVLTAVRLARGYTRRSKVVKFLGHYHGQDDQFLAGLDATGAPFGSGIPAAALQSTVLCRYGELAALERLLEQDRDIAAVILDPAMHSGGLWGSSTEYLHGVRALTRQYGVVLIFDEVITGFRLGLHGAQGLHGVVPDLATFGKALGAGEKLAAVTGFDAILRSVDPDRPPGTPVVFQSGTGNDGTFALAAGLAALRTYESLDADGQYGALNRLAERLAAGLREAFRAHAVPAHVNQLGSMLQLFFSDASPSFERFSGLSPAPAALFYLALINEGFLLSLPTSNHIYLSFAHTEADIDRALNASRRVLARYDFSAVVRAASATTG